MWRLELYHKGDNKDLMTILETDACKFFRGRIPSALLETEGKLTSGEEDKLAGDPGQQ